MIYLQLIKMVTFQVWVGAVGKKDGGNVSLSKPFYILLTFEPHNYLMLKTMKLNKKGQGWEDKS